MIKVWVAASSLALRAGLRALLAADPEVEVVGEAATIAPTTQLLSLVDVLVAAGTAVESVDDMPSPGEVQVGEDSSLPALLILAGESTTGSLKLPLALGWRAWGLLPADCTSEELLAAVKALQQGLLVGDPALMHPLFPGTSENSSLEPVEALTDREAQVLQRLAQGLANKQIASALGISEHTVKFHVSSIYSKLRATNRTEAVRIGVRQGLIVL